MIAAIFAKFGHAHKKQSLLDLIPKIHIYTSQCFQEVILVDTESDVEKKLTVIGTELKFTRQELNLVREEMAEKEVYWGKKDKQLDDLRVRFDTELKVRSALLS